MAERFAEVAVPLPLPGTLTYGVPERLDVAPGCRVRVTVGPRPHIGVVTAVTDQVPEYRVKPIREVLDLEPVVPRDLLELATFAANYYLAPIGEMIRVMLPKDLPPWGDLRVSLTDAGAVAPRRSPAEAALVEALLEIPRQRLAALNNRLQVTGLGALVEQLAKEGRVSIEQPGARPGVRYVAAVELRPGNVDDHLVACGRSPKARAVVRYLDVLGRPATYSEIAEAIGCGTAVVRRLVGKRVLRRFTQPERMSLGRHRLPPRDATPIVLRPDQASAVEALMPSVLAERFSAALLAGMTGSGKTEVYLRLVDAALERGRTALLLVPEIALVPSLAERASARYGDRLAILHSNLAASERQQEWERVRRGAASVVLGPRSAVFAPLANLGVVVVDEEHDGAYKQDRVPRYNGRDLALFRAREHGATAVLVSATPSLESRSNTETGKLTPLMLTARAGFGTLPEGILVDLRRERGDARPGEVLFSPRLCEEIDRAIKDGDQVILLRNRRGYSPVLLCRACGEDFRCPDCGLAMTYHRRDSRLICHYCEHQRPAPVRCPACHEEALEPVGSGTERVEERFRELYPDVPADVLDADAARRPGGAAAVLARFGAGHSQVLIGTQMVSKGHHFPRVALAGILSADTYLSFPDFRAVEKTYALLTQLAGRAGRGERPGRVVIQTYHPDHYAIRAALAHDDPAFAAEELRFRRVFHYPPYTRLVLLLSQHKDPFRARGILDEMARRLMQHPLARGVRFAGPAAAPLERLRGQWRFQMLMRGPSGTRLRRLVRAVMEDKPPPELTIDVDPYDLM